MGRQITTIPRGEGSPKRKRGEGNRIMSLSTRELMIQRRDEIMEATSKPLTPEEFLAKRLAEEAEERENLRRIREEYEQHERHIRAMERRMREAVSHHP